MRKRRPKRRNSLAFPKPRTPPSFKEAHWGLEKTQDRVLKVSEPSDNQKLIGLGPLLSVVYLTVKGGDSAPTEYEHKFRESDPPLLAYGDTDGRLYIVGGGYYMTKHGIVD